MKKISVLFFALLPASFFAQWVSNTTVNTPVCVATGKQNDPRVLDDGSGGLFIAWKDNRDLYTKPDIYMQHVDSLGNMLWTIDGVPVNTDSSDQSTPGIITDMAGGVIICWSDRRNGVDRDIYAQRIGPNGTKLWTANGVPIATKLMREHNEKIISDDAGGAIIAWEQNDLSTGLWDVWIQRINANGNPVWTTNGIPLTVTPGNRLNVKLQRDGKGGAYVCWQDLRNGIDYGVYAQHVDANGNMVWGGGAKMVADTTDSQINPKIDPDSSSGGVYIAWVDKRNQTDYNIFAQRMDSLGNKLWGNHGKPVCAATGNQSAIDILSNPKTNGLIVTWKDNRYGYYDIYAQRLTQSGNPAWTLNGIVVSNAAFDQLNPNITGDGNGGAIIAFQDSSTGSFDIRSQRISNTGSILWQNNGVIVGNAYSDQTNAKNVSDNGGGTIVAFMDKRTLQNDIYVHKIFYDGFQVGIHESSVSENISVYPNPFADQFTVNAQLNDAESVRIKILNVLGEEVMIPLTAEISAGGMQSYTIQTGNLTPGVYFLKIEGAKDAYSCVLVKQ